MSAMETVKPLIPLTVKTEDDIVLMDKFLKTFKASIASASFPKLDVGLEIFQERSYKSLLSCLTFLGKDLVELKVTYPKTHGKPLPFPTFSFPRLQKMTFIFSKNKNNPHELTVLQSLLNASENLKELVLPVVGNYKVVPLGFTYIQLPATITSLDLDTKMVKNDIGIILRNRLPNLTYLRLHLHSKETFEDGLFTQILEGVKKTVHRLEFYAIFHFVSREPKISTFFRFPRMEKLKKISIQSNICELGPEDVSELQECLPELEYVVIEQPEASIVKLVQKSKFEKVRCLTLRVVNDTSYRNIYHTLSLSPSLEIFPPLRAAFFNLRSMHVYFDIKDLTGLKGLFQNLVQLVNLTIDFDGNGEEINKNLDQIDCALLGLDVRLVATLKVAPEILETTQIIGNPLISILKLQALKSLTLIAIPAANDGEGEPRTWSFISDLLFHLAFMKMKKLRELKLGGIFKASLEMQAEWERQGRSFLVLEA